MATSPRGKAPVSSRRSCSTSRSERRKRLDRPRKREPSGLQRLRSVPSLHTRSFSRGLPLVSLAPAIVVMVGLATALVIAIFGIAQLERTSDDAAGLRAEALAATLAARLRATALEDRSELI